MPKSKSTSSGQTEVGFDDEGHPYTYKLKRRKTPKSNKTTKKSKTPKSSKSTSSGEVAVDFDDEGRPYTYKLKRTSKGKGTRKSKRKGGEHIVSKPWKYWAEGLKYQREHNNYLAEERKNAVEYSCNPKNPNSCRSVMGEKNVCTRRMIPRMFRKEGHTNDYYCSGPE